MSSVKVCRMCLAIDVRMFVLNGTLEVSSKALFGESWCSTNLPNYACYECSYIIQKFHKFKEKVITAQNILFNIMQVKEEITKIDISEIDRKLLNLQSSIRAQYLDVTYHTPSESYEATENSIAATDEVKDVVVKDEPQLVSVQNISKVSSLSEFDAIDEVPLKTFKEIELNVVKDESSKIDGEPTKATIEQNVSKPSVKSSKKTKASSQTAPVLRRALTQSQTNRKKREKTTPVNRKRRSNKVEKFKELEKDFVIVTLTLEEQQQEMEKKKDLPNYKESPFKCEKCYKGFLHESTLKNHMIYHETKAGQVECPVCHKSVSSTKSAVQQHMMRHETNFICRVCSFIAKQGYHAQRHANMHKGVIYNCPSCPEIFKNITSQQTHVRLKHPSQHVCDFCGYSFVSEQGLKMHKAKAHRDSYKYPEASLSKSIITILGQRLAARIKDEWSRTRKKKYPAPEVPEHEKESSLYCSVCDLKLADADAWKRHLATSAKHRDTLETACRDCGEEFSSGEALKEHIRSHARKLPSHRYKMYPSYCRGGRSKTSLGDDEYPATCELCEVTVTSRKQHYTHYQRCHREVPYPRANRDYMCEVCGQGFSVNARLQYHRAKHRETRSFACPQCPKAFYSKEQLKSHSYSHTALRPHACSLCGKGFKTKMALYAHLKRHEGTRRFPCQYCGKAFTTAPNMKTHIRQLHMVVFEKPVFQQDG